MSLFPSLFDEDDLLPVGVPEAEMVSEKTAQSRARAAISETMDTDWQAEIDFSVKAKNDYNNQIKKHTKQIEDFRDFKRKIDTQRRQCLEDMHNRLALPDKHIRKVFEGSDLYKEMQTSIARLTEKSKRCDTHIKMLHDEIESFHKEIKPIQDRIDYCREELAVVNRHKEWKDKRRAGFNPADVMIATRPAKSKSAKQKENHSTLSDYLPVDE